MNKPRDESHMTLRLALWIVLTVGASLGFSLAFACATPFVALATLAGMRMKMTLACATIVSAWLGNQAIGFLVLSYPRTWNTFGWGAAIVIAALLATMLAGVAARVVSRPVINTIVAFMAGFFTFEATLLAATSVLPTGGGAFSAPVVLRILEINAIAFAGLAILHHILERAGLFSLVPLQEATA